jgi:Domain of unknown function (DUF4124)
MKEGRDMKSWMLCVAIVMWAGLANATVYKWVDVQGKVQYGDRPPDGVHAEVIAFYRNSGDRATPRSSQPTPSNPRTTATPTAEQIANERTKKSIQEDVEASRSKQCSEARDRYQKYITSRRLYKEGKNGEREYLTAQEIDAERLNAKRDVDSVCNSST